MKSAIRDGAELCRVLELPPEYERAARSAAEQFALFAPRPFVARMKVGEPHDPLLRQVLPLDDELREVPGFSRDPVGDLAATTAPGLLQKYRGRALLVTTGACAIHCRYCFRRLYPYGATQRSPAQWQAAVDQIAADPTVEEVLLSGGDPLTIDDEALAELAAALAEIPHVRRLRVHTRVPIVIPQRVTESLLLWLRGTRLVPIVVVHVNHPAEIDDAVAGALGRLMDAGILVLNQSVLLRGVNDDADVLAQLSLRLVELRVMPYYLHQLDRVSGSAHFEVPIDRGRAIVLELRSRLPGYAVPRYVREVAGEAYKVPLDGV